VVEVSLLLLARLKARRLDDYSSLGNYTKKAVAVVTYCSYLR
jgi:hypothetical protein